MGIVIFNGVSSLDKGIHVEHPPGYTIPEKDYDVIHVPGRNGDIVIDNGSYKNVSRSYEIAIGSLAMSFEYISDAISSWLSSAIGYGRLEDSYEPNYYRMAMYRESADIENILFHAGRATINFDCKPQRYLKSGDRPVLIVSSGVLRNPTRFTALPILTVHGTGSGTIRIGNYTITISNIGTSMIIDSELQDAYRGSTNCNSDTIMPNGFPKLLPGDNQVTLSGGITSMEVIPKWWTI